MRNWMVMPVFAGVLFATGMLGAQVEFRIEANEVTDDNVTVDLFIDNQDEIAGWAFVFCHDESVLSATDVLDGSLFETHGVDFNSNQLLDGGVSIAAVLSFIGPTTLEPGLHQSHRVVYSIEGAADQTVLAFCSSAAWSPTESLAILENGVEAPLDLVDAIIPLGGGGGGHSYEFTASSTTVGYDIALGEATFDVAANIMEPEGTEGYPNDTYGFSMGLSHDADIVSLLSVDLSDAVDDLRGGLGPEFSTIDLLDGGVTVSVVYSLLLDETMAFGSSTQILSLTYETVPAALVDVLTPTETQLRWSDSLGDPNVKNGVVYDADGNVAPIVRNHGLVTLVPGGVVFIRGDATGNGAVDLGDAVRVLGYLFLERTVGCKDSADADDSGAVSIVDAIDLLGYLFIEGDPPAAPFPGCSGDPTPDLVDCMDGGSCD